MFETRPVGKQGQGNQRQTPEVQCEEQNGRNGENKMKQEETEKREEKNTGKWKKLNNTKKQE